ncbi:MAG: glycosyl hydrolase family 79 C-terminal domain-containing protein, partial [Solirubrobacteraceae bacterium]
FSLARAGVDGVDLHTLPNAAYQLFSFARRDGRWQARVAPVYYGVQLFAQAAPPGSRLLAVSRRGADNGLSVWATRAPDSTVRIAVIDKDPRRAREVTLSLPRGSGSGSTATVERLLAPSVSSRGGVTLGGSGYGTTTSTGRLAPARESARDLVGDRLTLSVPQASAALVTITPVAGG